MKTYPNQTLTTHLSLALSDYQRFDGVSDKEFYFLLEKYRCEKELDMTPNMELEDIFKEGNFTIEEEDLFDENEF